MSESPPPVLLALKPCYADLVFTGRKTAELRRRMPACMENRRVFIYVSSPVRQLRGGFRVERMWRGTPEEIWAQVKRLAMVGKDAFDAYYAGRTTAYALKIADVWECKNSVDLSQLKNRFPNFVVPQSWRSLRPEEYRSFRNMKRH